MSDTTISATLDKRITVRISESELAALTFLAGAPRYGGSVGEVVRAALVDFLPPAVSIKTSEAEAAK